MRLIALLLILLFIPLASAHLDVDKAFEYENYILDIGWSPEDIYVNDSVTISAILMQKPGSQPVVAESVFLRIRKNSTIFFAGKLAKPDNQIRAATFSFRPNEPGLYTIDLKLTHNEPVEAKIDVMVYSKEGRESFDFGAFLPILGLGIIILTLSPLVHNLPKKNRKKLLISIYTILGVTLILLLYFLLFTIR